MPNSYAGNSGSFPATITTPADGDQRNAASVELPLQQLADRSKYIEAKAGPSVLQFGSNDGGTADTTTRYIRPGWGQAVSASEVKIQVPRAGKLANLRIRTLAAPAGAGVVFTVRKNGVATALTATLATGGTAVADTTNTVTVAAGDDISVSITGQSGITSQPTEIAISIEYTLA